MEKMSFKQALLESLQEDTNRFQKKVRASKPLSKGFTFEQEIEFYDDFMAMDYVTMLNDIAKELNLKWKVFKKDDILDAKVTVTFGGLEGTFDNRYQNIWEELDFKHLVFYYDEVKLYGDGFDCSCFPSDVIKFYEQHPEVAKKHGLDLSKYL